MTKFIPLVKTVSGVLADRKAIDDHKKKKLPGLLTLVGVNVSFSHQGFVKVSQQAFSLIQNLILSLPIARD